MDSYRIKNPNASNSLGDTLITVDEVQLKSYETKPHAVTNKIMRNHGGANLSRIAREKSSGGASSKVDNSYDGIIYPDVEFWQCREFYKSIPRIFNTVEAIVLDIRNRDHHYSPSTKGNDQDKAAHEIGVKAMEDWDKLMRPKKMVSIMIRNLLVCGPHIISTDDWLPLQLSKVIGKRRNSDGLTTDYVKLFKGQPKDIPAKDFAEIGYIEEDREPWAIGKFHSLFTDQYNDIDGNPVHAIAVLHRQSLQDTMRIHHKYASPRVFYNVEGVSKEVLDDDIVPVIQDMRQGDRAAFNATVTPILETVDTSARFHESVINIQKETDIGTGSAKNRLITEPSAMADAKEAGETEDDQILGIMDLVKEFWDTVVIPKVTGLDEGLILWEWGAKDTFRIEFPDYIDKALEKKLISNKKARELLQEHHNWPTIDDDPDIAILDTIPEVPEPSAPGSNKDRMIEKALEASTAALQLDMVKTEKEIMDGKK